MQVKSQISPTYKEIEVHICNNIINDQVRELSSEISKLVNDKITGYDKNGAKMLCMNEIIRFFAENQKVMVHST